MCIYLHVVKQNRQTKPQTRPYYCRVLVGNERTLFATVFACKYRQMPNYVSSFGSLSAAALPMYWKKYPPSLLVNVLFAWLGCIGRYGLGVAERPPIIELQSTSSPRRKLFGRKYRIVTRNIKQ